MTEDKRDRFPHILLSASAETYPYTSPRSGGRQGINTPPRNRPAHAQALMAELESIREKEEVILDEQKALGLGVFNGIYLTFESEPGFELKFESLDFGPSGIELCTVKYDGEKFLATVFVPEGKLDVFLNRIQAYQQDDTPTGKPKHGELVESISHIRLAALEALWTDDRGLYPAPGTRIWWEVWLRRSKQVDYEGFLREHAAQLEIQVGLEALHFVDRSVVLAQATPGQMSRSIHLLSSFAELRRAKETADFFTGMDRVEQMGWINDTLARLQPPANDAPVVCLLDTGVAGEHPLLKPVLASEDMHSYDAANWGTDDRYGHGSPMAGLAIYGDLTEVLALADPVKLTHRLESVKITPRPEHHTDKHLYGAITRESISRPEVEKPDRTRVFCIAITSTDGRDRGRPSSWSAAVDALASGSEDEQKRLIVLSAGNTDLGKRHEYPDSNQTDSIHDPGQAWNAVTVGGYTEKGQIDTSKYPGWEPIAPTGDLSPASCTSLDWGKQPWPIKPDIVMEGGNMARSPSDGSADYIDDALQLLSTGHQPAVGKLLVSFGDTSAAAALAGRLAARLLAAYPEFWPETVRALLVHSARWTEAMLARFAPLVYQSHKRNLLRYCGYGAPDEELLFWSARDALTLIAQDSLQPFDKAKGKQPKTCDINLHTIPWPVDALRDLGETEVEMRVTLSYFVEPNPGERGWVKKFRYQSHGLRFAVKRPLESLRDFQQRINKQARDEEYGEAPAESGEWFLGERLWTLGSLHSDIWSGIAVELADRGYIAVYPVTGWWKERPNLERWGQRARYALVVSIRTPGVETDIYTPVVNQVYAAVEI